LKLCLFKYEYSLRTMSGIEKWKVVNRITKKTTTFMAKKNTNPDAATKYYHGAAGKRAPHYTQHRDGSGWKTDMTGKARKVHSGNVSMAGDLAGEASTLAVSTVGQRAGMGAILSGVGLLLIPEPTFTTKIGGAALVASGVEAFRKADALGETIGKGVKNMFYEDESKIQKKTDKFETEFDKYFTSTKHSVEGKEYIILKSKPDTQPPPKFSRYNEKKKMSYAMNSYNNSKPANIIIDTTRPIEYNDRHYQIETAGNFAYNTLVKYGIMEEQKITKLRFDTDQHYGQMVDYRKSVLFSKSPPIYERFTEPTAFKRKSETVYYENDHQRKYCLNEIFHDNFKERPPPPPPSGGGGGGGGGGGSKWELVFMIPMICIGF
jgi:hypothetical protein